MCVIKLCSNGPTIARYPKRWAKRGAPISYNELCKPWARPSTQGHLVCRTLYWWNPLPLADGQHYQSDQPCRHNSPFLQKCHKPTLWIQSRAGLHEKGLYWLNVNIRAIKATVSITTPWILKNLLKTYKSFYCLSMHGTTSKHSCPRKHITCSSWLVEHSFACLLSFHILHTWQWDYYPQGHSTHGQFEWSLHEYNCPLQVQQHLYKHPRVPQRWQGMVSKNARGRRGVARYFTFLGLLHVCVSIFALEDGKHVHKKRSFQATVGIIMFVWVMPSSIHTPNAGAQRMFWVQHDVHQGCLECHDFGVCEMLAIDLMQCKGMQPNYVTFVEVLNVCASVTTFKEHKLVDEHII